MGEVEFPKSKVYSENLLTLSPLGSWHNSGWTNAGSYSTTPSYGGRRHI